MFVEKSWGDFAPGPVILPMGLVRQRPLVSMGLAVAFNRCCGESSSLREDSQEGRHRSLERRTTRRHAARDLPSSMVLIVTVEVDALAHLEPLRLEALGSKPRAFVDRQPVFETTNTFADTLSTT